MNNSFRKTRDSFMNFIRVITLWAFLFNTVGPQILIEPATALDTVNNISDFNVRDIQIPLSFGEIKETIQGTNDNTVIHIQDAHCNYSAQHSIADIIHHLSDNYSVDLIMLEGGKGSYDLSVFTKIGDLNIRNRVSDYFVKEGRVSGAEFFAINNPDKIKLFGIEDENLYMANLNAYRKSLDFKKETDNYLNTLSHLINNFKRKIYSSELSDLDETIKAYKEKDTDFKEYVTTLSNRAQSLKINLPSFKNIASFSEIIKEEKGIDFKEANKERGALIGRLEAKLSKLEMEHLVKMTVDFKKQNITNEDFYAYLFKKARFANVDFTSLPNLVKYSEYVKKYERIDKGNLFREIKVLEDALMKNLVSTDDQKTLYALDKNFSVMKDMFNVSLIKEEYDYYKANRDSFNTEHFLKFIETKGPLYKFDFNVDTAITKLDSFRKDMEKFYACSLKRDNAFIKNMESKLKKENKRVTILVTGGFHTGNLKNILRDKGYSYIEVMPRMDIACVENNPYFHLLSGGKSQMETLVETSILNSNISPIHMLSEMGITGSRSGKNLYELSIDVKKALETDATKGIILMVLGGYLRLTHEPGSEFYEKIGEIDGKTVYAQREENEVYDTDVENMVIVEFDRNKLEYNGHQSVVDLLLKMAHAPAQNYAGLEAHSLKDFLIPLTTFCDIMIDKIGTDNVLKLMDICDREFGNSKRVIHVITGKDKARVPWRIASYSNNYGVNVAYTGDDWKFIEQLFHELNRAANSGLEHTDNNVVLERGTIASILEKIEARLDNRADFASAEMPASYNELHKKAARDYKKTTFGAFEVRVGVDTDKGYQTLEDRKCFLVNIDQVKKNASGPAEVERILLAVQGNIEAKIIDEATGHEYKFKGGFRDGWRMVLLVKAEVFDKIKTFGKEIRLILPASLVQSGKVIVQDYAPKGAPRADFAAAEMPKAFKVAGDIASLPKEGLEPFKEFYWYLMRPKFEPNIELNLDKLVKILRIREADKKAFKAWVEVLEDRTKTIWGLHPFGNLSHNSAQKYALDMIIEYERYEKTKRADFASAEMSAKHMAEMLKESGFQELAKDYFFNGEFLVNIFEHEGEESFKSVFVSALGFGEKCYELINICINSDEFTCPSIEMLFFNGKQVIKEISSGSESTTNTKGISADSMKSVSFSDQLIKAGFQEIQPDSGIFESTLLKDTKAIVICKNNKILFIGKKVNEIDSKNNPRLIKYEQLKNRYSGKKVDCFKIQAGQVTYNLNPSGDLTFFSLNSSRELPIELSKEQTYTEEPDFAGFAIGGVNTNETIDKLTELTGVSIEVIEKRAQPRNYSEEGFLAKRERFKDVLKRDNTEVFSKGFTHQELAEPLFYAMNLSHEIGARDQDVVEFLYRGKKYLVHSVAWMGVQESIFNDRLLASKDFVVRNVETKKEVSFSELVPSYIWRYGFYEGYTDYRVNPLDIIEVFFSERIPRADFATAEMPAVPMMSGDIDSGIHIDGKLQPLSLGTDYEKEELKTALLNVLSEAFKASTRNLFDGASLMVSLPINSEVSGVTIEEVAAYMASVQGVRVEADKKAVEFKVPGGNVTYYLFEDNDIGRAKLLTKLEEKQSKWHVSNDEMKRRSIVYSFAKDIHGITDKAFTVYLEGDIAHGKYRTPTPLIRCIAASIKVFNLFDLTRPDRKGITESDIKIATEDAARGIISISGLSLSEMNELVNDLVEKITKLGLFALSGKLFIKIRPVNWNDLIKFHEIEREVLRAV